VPEPHIAGNVPGTSIVCGCLAASGLLAGAVSLLGNTPEMGLRRWLSLRLGGESPVAWLRRSSASRSRLCRASSSCACVLTACFLAGCQLRLFRTECQDRLLVHGLIQCVEAAVEIEEGIELGHEVAGNGTGSVRGSGRRASG
jgi:hypothetical protein